MTSVSEDLNDLKIDTKKELGIYPTFVPNRVTSQRNPIKNCQRSYKLRVALCCSSLSGNKLRHHTSVAEHSTKI